MKHIGFDDSTVLREFAKIAGGRNLLKKEAVLDEKQVKDAIISKLLYDTLATGFLNSMSSAKVIAERKMLKEELLNLSRDKNRLESIPLVQLVADIKKSSPSDAGTVDDVVRSIGGEELIKSVAPAPVEEPAEAPADDAGAPEPESPPEAERSRGLPPDVHLKPREDVEPSIPGMADDGAVRKSAAEKTMIDEAHPGGGTKTELTHSKTDENLVETVVEQQKKDLEVATSVPKGTYATLAQLADALDARGYADAADKVDAILHKEAALSRQQMEQGRAQSLNMATSQFVDNLVNRLEQSKSELPFGADFLNDAVAKIDKAKNYIAGLKGRPITQAQQLANAAMSQLDNAASALGIEQVMFFDFIPNAVDANVNRYLTMAGQYGQMLQQQPKQEEGGGEDKDGNGVPDAIQRPEEAKEESGKATTEKDQPKKKVNPALVAQRKKLQGLLGVDQSGDWDRPTVQALRALKKPDGSPVWAKGMRLGEVIRNVEEAKKGSATTRNEAEPGKDLSSAEKAVQTDQASEKLRDAGYNYFKEIYGPEQEITPEMTKDINSLLAGAKKYRDLTNEKGFEGAKQIMLRELGKRWNPNK